MSECDCYLGLNLDYLAFTLCTEDRVFTSSASGGTTDAKPVKVRVGA